VTQDGRGEHCAGARPFEAHSCGSGDEFVEENPGKRQSGGVSNEDLDRARSASLESLVTNLHLRHCGAERIGPCPKCGGGDHADRFQVNIRKNLWFCRQCNPKGGDAIAFLRWLHGCDFVSAVEFLVNSPVDRRPAQKTNAKNDEDYRRRQAEKAAWLWGTAKPALGSPVEDYLYSRKIICPPPATLRYLPAQGNFPHAMIAALGLGSEIEPGVLDEPRNITAVHLTYLRPDGMGKADIEKPKQFRGPASGKPIVLSAPREGYASLMITEGIENALTIYQVRRQAVWAAGGANFMPKLAPVVPDYFETVRIVADDDEAGQRGAGELADALIDRGFPEVLTVGLKYG
jgi:Toprim domain/CHC2 zinc finger